MRAGGKQLRLEQRRQALPQPSMHFLEVRVAVGRRGRAAPGVGLAADRPRGRQEGGHDRNPTEQRGPGQRSGRRGPASEGGAEGGERELAQIAVADPPRIGLEAAEQELQHVRGRHPPPPAAGAGKAQRRHGLGLRVRGLRAPLRRSCRRSERRLGGHHQCPRDVARPGAGRRLRREPAEEVRSRGGRGPLALLSGRGLGLGLGLDVAGLPGQRLRPGPGRQPRTAQAQAQAPGGRGGGAGHPRLPPA